ncbi:MAG: hypothetical protein E7328_02590 [Clostridiales bacterium]|nr:hypothetical protein [Clostridiales bacterium]
MSLVIAVVMIVIILCKIGVESVGTSETDRRVRERENRISVFESRYISRDLENRIMDCIEDDRNYDEVLIEVFSALRKTEHLRCLTNGGFILTEDQALASGKKYKIAQEEKKRNQRIALDIMLANRGKISSSANSIGYMAYSSSSRALKEGAFEYVEMLQRLLRNAGANLELFYHAPKYIWGGSREYETACLHVGCGHGKPPVAFDRDIIFRQEPIPPIK